MGLLDNFKDVSELIRKAGDIDLYRRITGLESEVIDLTRANRRLELEVEDLKAMLAFRETLTFRDPLYYAAGDEVPFCPNCWESERKAIHVQGPMEVGSGTRYDCLQCRQTFIANRRRD